ncbi:ribonuclease Z [Psychrobacter sp. FDAARGOS_221]|uniref:ribonuclease Z n=1 Tax=Psychrobacter sp. FDAARGOS_221 TaxID=1975705 RepID=UPI000BB59846|nr:ribonuclease Z [Psychrobacter sp. FDAARGOS_221]PNK61362.1 MBL fold metallo-hydrolase [Psychrobacter sp. FDAARGOS_221]
MLQLTFLGTSAGIPTKHRNVTALAVECINPFASKRSQQSGSKKPWVLIDCGEATQHQLLHTKLSGQQLAAVCITHVHGDHCYGLPGLLASLAMAGRTEPLTIIAPKAIEQFMSAIQQTTELYLPYAITYIATENLVAESGQSNQPVLFDLSATHQLQIEVTKLSHRVDSYAYSLTQSVETIALDKDKLLASGIEPSPIWGQLQAGEDVITEEGQRLASVDFTLRKQQQLKIVVAGDNDSPNLLRQAVQGASLLVHEATYTQAVADKIAMRVDGFDPMHTTAKSVAQFAQAVNLPHLIVTHFSARYQPYDDPDSKVSNMADIRQEVEKFYQGNVWLARDFAQFEVSADGVKSNAKDKV